MTDEFSFTDKHFDTHEQAALAEIMRLRRDVRGNRFTDRPLEDASLSHILDAALMAPSVGFSQPWRFVVIRRNATKRAIADIFAAENAAAQEQFSAQRRDQYRQLKLEGITEAPVNIAVYYCPPQGPVLGQTSMQEVGEYSVVCAIQNMWLMARALNIGMGWVSILDPHKVARILGTPPDHKLVAYLCLGHVDGFYTQPELERRGWEQRRQRETVVFSEQFSPE